jgi:hypothetical protein
VLTLHVLVLCSERERGMSWEYVLIRDQVSQQPNPSTASPKPRAPRMERKAV